MSDQAMLHTRLSAVCGENVSVMTPSHADEILLTIPQDRLLDTLSALRREFAIVFVDLFGLDLRSQRGIFQLHLIYALDAAQAWLHCVTEIDEQTASFPSLGDLFPVTGWYERVVWEELGLVPRQHPLLRSLRLAPSWPERVYPAREGFTWGTRVAAGEPRLFELEAAPAGVVDYPLGPVRSGIVESGHYTLRTVGEELVDIFVQPFYKHRGIEQRAEEVPIEQVPLLAERISGTSAFAHSLAFCQACERLAGVEVPNRARFLRTLFAELERLYNHLGYHADLCQATGLSVAQAQFDIWKERVLRLNAQISGHRYLFGMNIPGGLNHDLTAEGQETIRELVSALFREMAGLGRQLLASPSHSDRLEHTGVLTLEQAREYCAIGPVGRASGRDRDLRRDHPYAAYAEMDIEIPVRQEGDALARARICLDEIAQALHLIEQVLVQLREGAVATSLPPLPGGESAPGWAESARGECLHWIRVGEHRSAGYHRGRN